MKFLTTTLLLLILISCGPSGMDKANEESAKLDSIVNRPPIKYNTIEHEAPSDTVKDTSFTDGGKKYEVKIKNYAGYYNWTHGADTVGKDIHYYKESINEISIGNKFTHVIDRANFSEHYPDKHFFYCAVLGTASLKEIDRKNKKVIFKSSFGIPHRNSADTLTYAVTFDGKFEFIAIQKTKAN